MLHNIINEQGHWLGVRDNISRVIEYFSHGFLIIFLLKGNSRRLSVRT